MMLKELSEKVYLPIIMFLLIQIFVSNEVFWLLGFALFVNILIHEHMRIYLPFNGYKLLLLFFIWGMILGVFIIGKWDTTFRDYLRDIFYYSTPIVYIYIGAYYARKGISVSRVLNSFIISSALISLIYLYRIVQQGALFLANLDIHGWRSLSGGGAIVIGVSLAVMLSGLISIEEKLPKAINILCLIISGLFFVLSLSRTNLLIIVMMTIVLTLKRANTKKALKRFAVIVFAILAVIGLFYVLLPYGFAKNYVTKILNSFTEVSTTNTWNAATIQANWRGYENYCAIEQWKNSSLIEQIFGCGFGRRIHVGNYAYLYLRQLYSDGTAANSIAVLHNGYATQLIKLGSFGVVLYLFLYLTIIKDGWKFSVITKTIEARLLLAVGITLTVQTFYLNGLFRDYCYYPVLLLIGYTAYKVKYKRELCVPLL